MTTDWIYRIAERLAPAHRRVWVSAMQAESEYVTTHRLAWAAGCLATALGQRMILMTQSQAFRQIMIRTLPGGLIAAFGFAAAAAALILLTGGAAVLAQGRLIAPVITCAVYSIPMLAGGLAIIVSDKSHLARVAGRWIFGLSFLWNGAGMIGLTRLADGTMKLPTTVGWMELLTGSLFIAASLALLFGKPRTFLTLGLVVLGVQVVQWAAGLAALPDGMPYHGYLLNFLETCLDSLVLLAASGLMLRSPKGVPAL